MQMDCRHVARRAVLGSIPVPPIVTRDGCAERFRFVLYLSETAGSVPTLVSAAGIPSVLRTIAKGAAFLAARCR